MKFKRCREPLIKYKLSLQLARHQYREIEMNIADADPEGYVMMADATISFQAVCVQETRGYNHGWCLIPSTGRAAYIDFYNTLKLNGPPPCRVHVPIWKTRGMLKNI